MVELLSPIALHDALAEASYGFRLLVLLVAQAYRSDRLGTFDKARAAIPVKKFSSLQMSLLWIQRIVLLQISELLLTPDYVIKRFRLP